MRESDPVSAIERGFKNAVESEDYAAAAKFRDAGAGLTGWWSGRGATEEEPGWGCTSWWNPVGPIALQGRLVSTLEPIK
jgi:hypothetical protein